MSHTKFPWTSGVVPGSLEAMQVRELGEDAEAGDWITRLLSSGLFRHLTPENSHRFFAELEPLTLQAGKVVVAQGQPGHHLYIITQGRCAVTRQAPNATRELQLAVLKEGDTFGEGALISGTPRATTVRMLSDGTLMRLGRRSFERLVRNPTLKSVAYREACEIIEQGGVWLDVRHHDDRTSPTLTGSVNAPSQLLHLQAPHFDRERTYVVYCERGTHSATGAFLLTRLGFDAYVLEGGLQGLREKEASQRRCADVPAAPAGEPAAALDVTTVLRASDRERDAGRPAGGGPAAQRGTMPADAAALRRRNRVLMRLVEIHRSRESALERQLEEARIDGLRGIEMLEQRLGRRLKKARKKLGSSRKDQADTRARLEQTQAELAVSQEQLRRTLSALRDLKREYSRLEAQLAHARVGRQQALVDREQTDTTLVAALSKLREGHGDADVGG